MIVGPELILTHLSKFLAQRFDKFPSHPEGTIFDDASSTRLYTRYFSLNIVWKSLLAFDSSNSLLMFNLNLSCCVVCLLSLENSSST